MRLRDPLPIAVLLACSTAPVTAQESDPDDVLWGYHEADGDSAFARYELRWLGGPLEIAYAPYGRTPVPLTDLRLSADRLRLAFTWPDGARCELDGSPGAWSGRDLVEFRWAGECVPESGEPWAIAVGLADPPDYGQSRPADELDLQIIDRAAALLDSPDSWNRNDDRLCEDDERTGRRSLFCALHRASLDVAGEYLHARRSLDLVRLAIRERTGLSYVHTLLGYNNHPDTTLEDILERLREGRSKVERELTNPFRDPGGDDPLRRAASEGDLVRVEALLSRGVPPERPGQEWTPLQAAAYQGHARIVRALVAAGARLEPEEDTPLMLAAWRGHVAIARFLLDAGAKIEATQPYQVLEEVAAHGHLSILEMLVGHGADVNQRFRNGWTPILTATSWNRPDVVRALIAEGADVDLVSDGGLTALVLAARRNQVELVDALLDAGADPELAPLSGRTALMWAAYGGRLEAARVLLRAGASVTRRDEFGMSAIDLAAKGGHTAVAELLMEAGSGPPSPDLVPRRGDSPNLIEAARVGDDASVRHWIARGAALDSTDERGRTPLMMAAMNTHAGAIEALLEAGSAVDARDDRSHTALLKAAAFGFEARRAIELLIAHGASVDPGPRDEESPLGYAAGRGRLEAVEVLLEAGADVNARLEDGETALMYAAYDDRTRIVGSLVASGADVDAADARGRTALHLAAWAGRAAVVRRLVGAGADPDAGDARGKTALIGAAENGHDEVVATLLELGAQPHLQNADGETALSVARREGWPDVAQPLQRGEP